MTRSTCLLVCWSFLPSLHTSPPLSPNAMIAQLLRSSLILAAGLGFAAGLAAQTPAPKFPQASPPTVLKQQVGITDIEITYARPSMKGRRIFGGLVPYGEVWRTGANSATRITFSTPVNFGGTDVPAGTYELFAIPNETVWTVILQKAQEKPQWGSYTYDQKNDVARVTGKVTALASPSETFWIGLNDLRDTSATLNFTWEHTRVSVPITIDTAGILGPQIEAAMADPETAKKIHFPAAMFYFENNLDLKQALAWMDAGLAAQPNAFWMIYRKALILEKAGDKAGAKAAAEQSLALAEADKREGIRKEYITLNKALLARLQ